MASYHLLRILHINKAIIRLLTITGLLILSMPGQAFGNFSPTPAQAAVSVYYAAPGGQSAGNCASWGTACELAYALKNASTESEIWVKEGTYKPGSSPADTFQLKTGIAIYGGFTGSETSRDQANWYTHPTILSGDVAGNDLSDLTHMEENNQHVVTANAADSTAVLNGFYIQSGNAKGTSTTLKGGAVQVINASPTLKNLVLSYNYADRGGGIECYGDSVLTLTNIRYEKNQAQAGGGLNAEAGCIVKQFGAVFSANRARTGAAVNNDSASVFIYNASMSGNTASAAGGGISNNGTMILVNSILWNNHLNQDLQQIDLLTGQPPVAIQDIIQGGFTGTNIRDVNPRFAEDPTSGADTIWGNADDTPGNLMLRYDSPAIDTGSSRALPDPQMRDLRNWPRIIDHPRPDTAVGPLVDLGGYEAGIIFTRKGANGRQDGSSWQDAFPELNSATAFSHVDDEIWVTAGTYQAGSDRASTIMLKDGLAIYGGFAGAETFRNERNWVNNKSILSGVNTSATTRSYHVVKGVNVGASAVLDGFTIQDGNADGAQSPDNQGGGIYLNNASPTLQNLTITQNAATAGGGIFITGTQAGSLANITFANNLAGSGGGLYLDQVNVTNSDLVFQNNQATESGGGLYSTHANYHLTGGTFLRNTAVNGAGMANFGSSAPILINIYYQGNAATSGGGMYNADGASPDLSNAIFAGNRAYDTGGVYNKNLAAPALRNVTMVSNVGGAFYSENTDPTKEPLIVNSVSWDNTLKPVVTLNSAPDIMYSLFEGGCPPQLTESCTNVLSNDPLIYQMPSAGPDYTWGTADDDYGDLRLKPGSKAIDAGLNDGVNPGVTTDIAGRPRIIDDPNAGSVPGPIVDMGAYENRVAPSTTQITSFSAEPSYVGQEVTVKFQVTGDLGSAATGIVQVSDGVVNCSAAANIGQCNLTFSTPGSKTFVAHFLGDLTYDPSYSEPYVHQVSRIPAVVTLTFNPADRATMGQKVHANFVVSPAIQTTYQPGGTVTVASSAASCSAPITQGSCDLVFADPGSYSVTANYSGDTFFDIKSSNPVIYKVTLHMIYSPLIFRNP